MFVLAGGGLQRYNIMLARRAWPDGVAKELAAALGHVVGLSVSG